VREIAPAADAQSRTFRVKLQLTGPIESVRLGMTGDAILPPAAGNSATAQSTYTLPATAIFHQESHPAVWVVTGNDSTLQLRQVTISSYTDQTSVVTAGLKDGDVVVLAGVHTVYAGQHVKPVRPLFDGEGNVDGPAPAPAAANARTLAAAQ
jgi:multidrug efflux system membrane fusion protein